MDAENLERRSSDVVAGAVVAVFGVAYALFATQIPPDPSTASILGPGVVPLLLGILLAVGGAVLALTGLRLRPAAASDEAARGGGGRKLWITLAIFGVYVIAFIPVGYLLSTAAFLMGLTSYFSPKTWRSNIAYAVLFSAAVYVMFEYALRVPLPEGLLSGIL